MFIIPVAIALVVIFAVGVVVGLSIMTVRTRREDAAMLAKVSAVSDYMLAESPAYSPFTR